MTKQLEGGLNGGESTASAEPATPVEVSIDWRITATDPATHCIRAVEVDGKVQKNITELRGYVDGRVAVGEIGAIALSDGQYQVTMRLVENARIMWQHPPCRRCMPWRREIQIDARSAS